MGNKLAIFFCGGLLRGDDDSREFYELLDVDRDASIEDVKRAYRKASLALHPDKLAQRGRTVTDEDRHKFQRMKEAYEVLCDPEKKRLYDELGEAGMKMVSDPAGSFHPDILLSNFMKMSTRDRANLALFVVIVVGLILLFPLVFCAKADGSISASWTVIWTPLWVYDAAVLATMFYYISLGKIPPPEGLEDNWKDPYPMPQRLFDTFMWIMVFLLQIFVTSRLDGNIKWDWAAVLSPWMVWEALNFIRAVRALKKPLPDPETLFTASTAEDGTPLPQVDPVAAMQEAMEKRVEARHSVVKGLLRIWQLIFLVLKLDDDVDWSWWAVFSPACVYLTGLLLSYMLTYLMAKALLAEARSQPPTEDGGETDEQRAQKEMASVMTNKACTSCCCWCLAVTMFVLAVVKIDGEADYSVYAIFSPGFIIAGCIVLCMVCFICCAREMDEEGAEGEGGVFDVEGGGAAGGGTGGGAVSDSDVRPVVAGGAGAAGGATGGDASRKNGTYNPPSVLEVSNMGAAAAGGGGGAGEGKEEVDSTGKQGVVEKVEESGGGGGGGSESSQGSRAPLIQTADAAPVSYDAVNDID